MWFQCQCGSTVHDTTDYLSNKAHLIADQDFEAMMLAVEQQVIDAVAGGTLDRVDAYNLLWQVVGRTRRWMYQCEACGRLHVPRDQAADFLSFSPDLPDESAGVLRGNPPPDVA